MDNYVKNIVKKAKESFYSLSKENPGFKNKIIHAMAENLLKKKKYIQRENQKDIASAKKNNLKDSYVDRLVLSDRTIREMSGSLREIEALKDPVGRIIDGWRRDNGLKISKVSVPIGVILMIYEARPNVTSDCVGLCLKSSNIAILRGGSDAMCSNKSLVNVFKEAARGAGAAFDLFFFIDKPSYSVVDSLLKEDEYIDLVIPRGGEALIKKVVNSSSIPVIKHYKGNCHIFVDEQADIKMAVKICVNAKVQRPSVCNAVETILVHSKAAAVFLPRFKKEADKYKVEIRGCKRTAAILKGVKTAKEKDWHEEYLSLIVAVKVVDSVDEAAAHINFYGSRHTDAIVTDNYTNADKFVRDVDSACCFVNVSTRFSDGYQFGLGAEIGISTDKLHARGPMGVDDLVTYKYVVSGEGLTRK